MMMILNQVIGLVVILLSLVAFFLVKAENNRFCDRLDWFLRQIFFLKYRNRPVGFILGGTLLSGFILGIPFFILGEIPFLYCFFAFSIQGFMYLMYHKSSTDPVYSNLQKNSVTSQTYSFINKSDKEECYNAVLNGIPWILRRNVTSEKSFKSDVIAKVASSVSDFLPSVFFTNSVLRSQSEKTITTLMVYNFKQNLDEAIERVSMRISGLELANESTTKVLEMFTDIKFLSFDDKSGLQYNLSEVEDRVMEIMACPEKEVQSSLLAKTEQLELLVLDTRESINELSITSDKVKPVYRIKLVENLTQRVLLMKLEEEFYKGLGEELTQSCKDDLKLFVCNRFFNSANRQMKAKNIEYNDKGFIESNVDILVNCFKKLPQVNPRKSERKLEAAERIIKKDIAKVLVDEFPNCSKSSKTIQGML